MAERKWGAIASGATFESLAATIVFSKDPSAALFGRRGPDGGQDARSGDGKRVFQAKHHESGSAAKAISDAKKEAKKIQEYRQVGHARYEQWQGVTHWRLVTNAAFNPSDQLKWDTEVVPLFQSQGLEADYWGQEKLDALLDKHPEIHRSFFENKTRAFLSIPEVLERLPSQELFLRRDQLGAFCGRTTEINEVKTFLISSQRFLVLHGPGGMGKTRLLLEAGETIAGEDQWQVLWANVASMAATGAWFESIVPERQTLLLVDEPDDDKLLQQLSEQLGGKVGRASQWKVAVAVRSPKDPVLKFLRGPRMKPQVQELEIKALPQNDAEAMCLEILKTGTLATLSEPDLKDLAQILAQRFSYHPVWLTLAIHLLEEKGDLTQVPSTASDLAEAYLSEVEQGQTGPPETIRNLLRWTALIGTVYQDDNATIEMIGNKAGFASQEKLLQCIKNLVERRALIQRGAFNRIVELKPDVLRDHLLNTWLSVNQGYGNTPIVPSEASLQLIKELVMQIKTGALTRVDRSILASLARTESILCEAGQAVPLLADFFEQIEAELSELTASQRLILIDALEIIGSFQPERVTRIVRLLRKNDCDDEQVDGLLGALHIGQGDVLLGLPWPLFHAAMGAEAQDTQESVLRELCELVKKETDLAPKLDYGLPNDGKRAGTLIKRVIAGGPQFWGSFDEAAKKLGLELLDKLAGQQPTTEDKALLEVLIQPAIDLERQQVWSDENKVHIRRLVIDEDHPGWAARNHLLSRIKEILTTETTPVESRIALWHLLSEAHHDINRKNINKEEPGKYHAALLANLSWTFELLNGRQGQDVKELNAARELWDWHCRFESNNELKEKSQELESLYNSNALASEFEPLLNRHNWEQRGTRMSDKAGQLAATAQTPAAIEAFLDQAINFLGDERKLSDFYPLAFALGEQAESHVAVQQFIEKSLAVEKVSSRIDFTHIAATSWIASLRRGSEPEQAYELTKKLLEHCKSEDQRTHFLLQIYGHVPRPQKFGNYTPDELDLFRAQQAIFQTTEKRVRFLSAIATTFDHDWSGLQKVIEAVLQSLSNDDLPYALSKLIDGIYWGIREKDAGDHPPGLGEWLLNQLLRLPSLDDLNRTAEWYLEETLKKTGRPQVSWLPSVLSSRRQREAQAGDGTRAISYRARISKYVQPIMAADLDHPNCSKAVNELLEFVDDNGSIGYHMPKILHDIDPEGLIVPGAVAKRFPKAVDSEAMRRLSRIASCYELNSLPWRVIAKAALLSSNLGDSGNKKNIYSALGEVGIRSWSGQSGEVPELFYTAVKEAKATLDSESDEIFRPYWEWRLSVAEAELQEQVERAKEERGE